MRDTSFSVGLEGIALDDVEKVTDIIDHTMLEVAQ